MNKLHNFLFWCKKHFAVRIRNFDSGIVCGCFGPICFVLRLYRCGKHIAASDVISHLKKEEIIK